jgi:CubicO group peptidase (beta-lactamase class C family)
MEMALMETLRKPFWLNMLTSLLLTGNLLCFSPSAVAADDAFPPATPESQGIPAKALRRISEEVQRYVDEDRIVGAELLVIKNRRTVLHETFGWDDREAKKPMERDSIFNLRSMTKTLTGAGAQILIDAGKLSPASSVAEYLPGFENEKSRTITVEQLLTHRSGLPLVAEGAPTYPTDLFALANEIGRRGPEFQPGSKFWYSDPGSDSLGALTAVVSGKSLDEFRNERLLKPLQMEDTFTPTDRDDPRYKRIVCLYLGTPGGWSRFWTPEDEPRFPVALGSSNLYGTARDYARFLAMWMDNGMAGDVRLLSTEAITRTLTPTSLMTAAGSDIPVPSCFRGLETRYGQMAMVYADPDAPTGTLPQVIGHSGSDGTWAWAWPELDLMVLYFTQSRGQGSGFRLAMLVDRVLIPGGKSGATLPAGYKPYLGTYLADFDKFRNQEFEVLEHDGRLMLDIPSSIVYELKDTDVSAVWTAGLHDEYRLAFVRDEEGGVTAMRIGHDVLPRGKVTRGQDVRLTLATVEKLLGSYEDPGSGQVVEIVFKDGSLAVEVPGIPQALAFYPPDEEGLWTLVLNPQSAIRFNAGEDGVIESYSVVAGGVERAKRMRVSTQEGE